MDVLQEGHAPWTTCDHVPLSFPLILVNLTLYPVFLKQQPCVFIPQNYGLVLLLLTESTGTINLSVKWYSINVFGTKNLKSNSSVMETDACQAFLGSGSVGLAFYLFNFIKKGLWNPPGDQARSIITLACTTSEN